jgi:hypothetical protein
MTKNRSDSSSPDPSATKTRKTRLRFLFGSLFAMTLAGSQVAVLDSGFEVSLEAESACLAAVLSLANVLDIGMRIMMEQAYTGADNLTAMTVARRYNEFLVSEVLRHSGGAAVAVDFGAGSGTFASKLRECGQEVVCIDSDRQGKAGLSVFYARYADSLGFLVTLLYRLVGSRRGDWNLKTLQFYDRRLFPISRLLDRVLGRVLGKNVAIAAVRPAESTQVNPPVFVQRRQSLAAR